MALIVALALMTGLQGELRDRILGSMAHVYVWRVGGITDYHADVARIETFDGVVGAAPALEDSGLLTSDASDTPAFISVKGVDPALEGRVTEVAGAMIAGKLSDLHDGSETEWPGILIGKTLAQKLRVKVGDTVHLITTRLTLTPGGALPRPRTLQVAGIYSLGLYEFDAEYGFVDIQYAERLMGKTAPDRIQVKVADRGRAPEIAAAIKQQSHGDYETSDWTQENQQLLSALGMEKLGMSIAVGLIVLVGALNIIASLILLVMEKTRDIAILKTMGTASRVVMRIFMMQGLLIGLIGTAIGAVSAVVLCWVLTTYRLVHIPQDVYQVSYIPFIVLPRDFIVVVATSLLITFLATIYPSRQAAHLDPVQALRFE
jgi:lipoprotein-releasing system permease protein